MLVKLTDLVPGGDINSRGKDNQKVGIDSLANSIKELGLIQPLAVIMDGDKWRVIDGNRRLAALKKLHPKANGTMVEVVEQDVTEDFARMQSIAANIEHLPLHPIDQYEAFAKLDTDGMDLSDIAAAFGITERQVRQQMALGALCKEARQAWRDGGLTAELARKLTRVDKKQQLKLLLNGGAAWEISKAIDQMTRKDVIEADSPLAKFVGLDSYIAAGGSVVPDLFAEDGQEPWADVGLVHELAEHKRTVLSQVARAEGWQFFHRTDEWIGQNYVVETETLREPTEEERLELEHIDGRMAEIQAERDDTENQPQYSPYEWQQLEERWNEIELGRQLWTDEQKARLGVVIDDHCQLHYGCSPRKGTEPKPQAEATDTDEATKEKPLSHALVVELDGHLTNVVRAALVDSPGTATRLLALTFLSDYFIIERLPMLYAGVGIKCDFSAPPVPATDHGKDGIIALATQCGLLKAKNFEAKMKAMWKLTDPDIEAIIAFFVARSLQTRHRGSDLVLYLQAQKMLEIRKHFTPDADNFFSRLTKEQLLHVAADMSVDIKANHWDQLKKAELVAAVVKRLTPEWIPEAMRPKKPE